MIYGGCQLRWVQSEEGEELLRNKHKVQNCSYCTIQATFVGTCFGNSRIQNNADTSLPTIKNRCMVDFQVLQ